MRSGLTASAVVAIALLLAGCSDASGPWLIFDGGGFVFNYRTAEAYYGFNVRPQRRLDEGTVLEATFEDPAGGAPITVSETVHGPALRYSFQTPPLQGITAGKPYTATIQVLEAGTHKVLASYEHAFKSQVDQSWLPDQPLVTGPGYTPNPDLKAN